MRSAICGIMAMTAAASSVSASQTASGPERSAILNAARRPVTARLRKPVSFKITKLNRDGDWIFLSATMEDGQGKPISYVGTPLADAAAQGMVSHLYVALLQRRQSKWQVVDSAIGPTDVAWENWAQRYGAPAAIFQ
jgi:hypothetical protein